MLLRWRAKCRWLLARSLWIVCFTACVSSLVVVFCSVQYIEDHHDRNTRVRTGDYETSSAFLEGDGRRDLEGILKENRELKQTVNRLQHSLLGGLGVSHSIGSWQERSLKFIPGDVKLPPPKLTVMVREDALNCKDIARIHIVKELGRGYTKVTHLGVYNGQEVAVKSAGLDSIDVQRCVQEKRSKLAADCLLFSRYKIMKELLLYQQLRHPNIIRLLGYCLQNDMDTEDTKTRGLTVVTEPGIPVDLMALLQTPWHLRFRIAFGLARLVKFFSDSPLGSLLIRDFQLRQFVLVDDEIKLSDLDDIGNEPKVCNSSNDCFIGNKKHNVTLKCWRNECQGYNEMWNIYSLHRFYLMTFLLPGAPKHVQTDLGNVEAQVASLNTDSKNLVKGLESILIKLRNGEGLSTTLQSDTQYKVIPRADFPGRHDYYCSHSWSMVNCQFLAFNEDEAKRRCNDDQQCKAFVMSYEKTWIGYRSVYLKNDTSQMVFSAHNIVYVKVT